jgi:hypothetical protein
VLLDFGAPAQLDAPAGLEHGRTIPLAVLPAMKFRVQSPPVLRFAILSIEAREDRAVNRRSFITILVARRRG